ncbi:hypothetical protein F5144DRAFT_489216 [Chaetomium tenue]|uniref:Uncharacterized protein n=1 Tax=Chaetomium tenue TaxID=1854479 RepID=A0ACB7P7T2_9PEZI|nr:hypothetical protein F5144DRAFT_489216 [Chaetomium globosum]
MPTTAAPTPPSAQGKSNQENERTTSGVATTIIAPSQIKSATTLGPDKFKIASSSPSAVSSTKTVALGNHEALVFPPAPGASAKRNYEQLKKQREADFQVAVGLGQEISEAQSRLDELLKSDLQAIGEITCPYCLYALPAQEMFEDRKWQNHVKNDLDPYVCLFENCNEPDLLYSHSEEWLSHMRQHGMLWRCSSHRKLGPFSTREEYMEHVRRDHRSKHSDAQLRALANRSTHKTANLFPSCPLCGKHEVETDNRLEDHIAGHLRSLALKSLPSYQEDIPDDAGSGRSSVDTSRPRSRSTVKDLNSDDDMLEFEAEHSWDHSDSASSSQEAWELASWNFYESAAEGPPTALEDDPIIQSMLQKRDGSQKGKAVAAVEPNVIPPALASATPSSSQEAPPAEQQPPAEPQPFHNFLRAFYPFKPNDFVSDSSVRLALDTGDIVLVHSVDPSGWADGNLLISGKRGWLPTNYCEPYEPGEMRVLLEAVLNLWDVLRSATSEEDNEIFRDQEFIRGTIAGVRFLLVPN